MAPFLEMVGFDFSVMESQIWFGKAGSLTSISRPL